MNKMRAPTRRMRKMTPRVRQYGGVQVSTYRRDYKSISQADEERERRKNFDKGCRWAALLLCGMFLFLAYGAVMWGW